VAEGVEEHSQQAFLAKAGCEIMQGYHFVRPMPGDQLAKWLSADHGFTSREAARALAQASPGSPVHQD